MHIIHEIHNVNPYPAEHNEELVMVDVTLAQNGVLRRYEVIESLSAWSEIANRGYFEW
ncbi:hypothetical protein ACW2QC_09285 [Virgibacillus sp. FSP13]